MVLENNFRIVDRLFYYDMVDLYLVQNSLKPASIISTSSDHIGITKKYVDNGISVKKSSILHEAINELEEYLDYYNISYVYKIEDVVNIENDQSRHEFESFHLDIASTKDNLDVLLNSHSLYDCGISLGYPEDAVKYFENNFGNLGEIYEANLVVAKKAGIEIPSWLAYVSFIPNDFDLLSGSIPKLTEEYGKRNQTFIKSSHPELAKYAEYCFYNNIGID